MTAATPSNTTSSSRNCATCRYALPQCSGVFVSQEVIGRVCCVAEGDWSGVCVSQEVIGRVCCVAGDDWSGAQSAVRAAGEV